MRCLNPTRHAAFTVARTFSFHSSCFKSSPADRTGKRVKCALDAAQGHMLPIRTAVFEACFPPGCYCVQNRKVNESANQTHIRTDPRRLFRVLYNIVIFNQWHISGVRERILLAHKALVSFPTNYWAVLLHSDEVFRVSARVQTSPLLFKYLRLYLSLCF